MRTFTTPTVVVSQCLEFAPCRYNGDVVADRVVKNLLPYVRFIPICPEVEIGLGTPRETVRLVEQDGVQRLIQPSTGEDITERMLQFAEQFLGALPDVDGFLLKSRSPSCGTHDVKLYAGNNQAPVIGKGSGLFGRQALHMFGHLAIEEEGRLKNFTIREHFFTKLFTLAEFKVLKKRKSMKQLVQFHTDYKYVFMAYNQLKLKEMGRIVANHEKRTTANVLATYEHALHELFQKSARYTSHMNVCQHIFGYFKDYLEKAEKEHFLLLLQRYAKRKIPLSSLLTVLRSWTIRFEKEYLLRQTYFEPYPEALMEITDSGKGRDY